MSLVVQNQPVPLTTDSNGVVRIDGTRVTLETVLTAFQHGATAEQIVHDYSVLTLPDLYAVITYYLQYRSDVEKYLSERKEKARIIREEMEQRFDPHGIRDRLLARRGRQEQDDVATIGG